MKYFVFILSFFSSLVFASEAGRGCNIHWRNLDFHVGPRLKKLLDNEDNNLSYDFIIKFGNKKKIVLNKGKSFKEIKEVGRLITIEDFENSVEKLQLLQPKLKIQFRQEPYEVGEQLLGTWIIVEMKIKDMQALLKILEDEKLKYLLEIHLNENLKNN